ncbi:response regulator transcription factor [Clostridium hydrogenum]|uniref:response regulator transcription factor n=1 Tax=Clostridium hydrogenum TaxID=2855764 RepID=UPI001F4043CE|nr:response regulator [Clostridium hydrogenum]
MIKILIVDDEPFIRQGLKILINWEQYGYKIVAEAANGIEAIKEIEKKEIDLIIVDIKMPEMNGIELIEYVRANIPKRLKFIVLSGYYEFEYAKKAIKYNVTDYILKPIQKDELVKVLNSFREEYLKQENSETIQRIKDKVVYDTYLNEIIYGKCNKVNLQYVNNCQSFSGELRYIIIEIRYYDDNCSNISEDEKIEGKQRIYEKIIGWLGENYYNVIIDGSKCADCYEIGFIYDKRLSKEQGIDEKRYIEKLKMVMKRNEKYDIYMYIGQKVSSIKELSVSCKTATVAKLFSNYSNENNVAYYDEIIGEKGFNYNVEKQYMDKLIHEIEEDNEEEIIKCVDKIYNSFKEQNIDLEIIKLNINYLLFNIINIAKELESEVNHEEVMQYFSSISFEQMISRGSIDHFKRFSLEFAEYLKHLRQNSAKGILNKIDREIAEHYKEKLSLKYLSEKYYINSAYLGQIFKKHYKVSFNEYLNAYRIEKAAQLLKRGDDKIYKIAEKVGFNNTDYFINKFVKLKEKTPLQYRKQFFKCDKSV